MRRTLIAIGGILTLGLLYALLRETTDDIYEEARRNRVRILNQRGQLPGELDY